MNDDYDCCLLQQAQALLRKAGFVQLERGDWVPAGESVTFQAIVGLDVRGQLLTRPKTLRLVHSPR